MKRLLGRADRNERGAALVLAISFMLVVAGISAGVVARITSGMHGRIVLDNVRNREYAADGAIEAAIAQVRTNMTGTQALAPCPAPSTHTLNDVQITVDCSYAPSITTGGLLQRNVEFSAHCASGQPVVCPNDTTVIIRAQVNFESVFPPAATHINVRKTYIQSWSVHS